MVNQATYSNEEIISIVNRVMMEEFEAEESMLRPDANLRDDLGMDSLDGVDLVVALEVAFGFRIAEQEARGIRTLGDVHERIRKNVGAD